MDRRRSAYAQLALLGIAAVWGSTFVLVQDAVAHISVLGFLGWRFLAAAVLVALVFRGSLRRLSRAGWQAGLVMGVFLTAGYGLQTEALRHTTASNAGFITGLFVVLTPLMGALLLGRRVPRLTWAGAAVSALGLALLVGVGADLRPLGDGLAFACAVAFSAHILVTDAAVRRHEVGGLLAVQLGVCGVVCMLGAAATGTLEAPSGTTVWTALVLTAVVASALGFWVQTYAQRHAPPARTALILACEPAFAGLFGFWLQDDRLGATGVLGALLILGAIFVVEGADYLRRPRRRAEPAAA